MIIRIVKPRIIDRLKDNPESPRHITIWLSDTIEVNLDDAPLEAKKWLTEKLECRKEL